MKMYRMLIVEDEYWIRRSICSQIKDLFENQIEALEAGDGEEALEILKKKDVSFVLTDLNMPFMDGITLISHTAKQYSEIPVIVLSGYSDFHLVREALTGGALDYLLKPVKESDLRAAVEKMCLLVEKRNEEKKKTEEARLQENIYRNYINDLTISSYVCQKNSDGFVYSQKAMKAFFDELHFPLYMAVIQKKSRKKIEDHRESVLERRYRRKERLAEWMQVHDIRGIENAYRSEEYIVFSQKEKTVLEHHCLKLNKTDEMQNDSLYICISEKLHCIEEIPRVYKECILKLISNAEYGKSFQYMILNSADRVGNSEHEITEELENEILDMFRERKKEQLSFLLLNKLGLENLETDHWLVLEVKQVFNRLQSLIQMYYQRKLTVDEMWEIDSLFDSIEIAVLNGDTEEIEGMLHQLLGMLMHDTAGECVQGRSSADTIGQIQAYIDVHYTENISLSFLANKFYLTPSYLSRSFKKQTGKNLIAYMTEKRLDEAVDYIKENERSLTEVAFLVGYDDYTYFNKVFRRYMGISPTQYRENFEKGKNTTSGLTKNS